MPSSLPTSRSIRLDTLTSDGQLSRATQPPSYQYLRVTPPTSSTAPTPLARTESPTSRRNSHVRWTDLSSPRDPGASSSTSAPRTYKHRRLHGENMKYAPIPQADPETLAENSGRRVTSIREAVMVLFGAHSKRGTNSPHKDGPSDPRSSTTNQGASNSLSHSDRSSHPDSHHTHSHDHPTAREGFFNSVIGTTGQLATTLGSALQDAHMGCSRSIASRFPAPEEPCGADACCCWQAFHILCLNTDPEESSDGEEASHSRPHDGQTQLDLKSKLDPLDCEGCDEHCCDESRYFHSTKFVRAPTCHG